MKCYLNFGINTAGAFQFEQVPRYRSKIVFCANGFVVQRWAEVEKLKNEITALESGLRAAQKNSRDARDALLRSEEEHKRLQSEITSLTLSKQVPSLMTERGGALRQMLLSLFRPSLPLFLPLPSLFSSPSLRPASCSPERASVPGCRIASDFGLMHGVTILTTLATARARRGATTSSSPSRTC